MRILYILETKTYIALEFRSLRTLVSKKMHLITYFDLLNVQTGKKGKVLYKFFISQIRELINGCFEFFSFLHRARKISQRSLQSL